MIVGFPGETEADFNELCQFVEAAQFDRMGAFSYSDEDTSKSFALDAKVDGRTIQNRKRKLMAIQRKISRARNRTLVGREMDVLIEGPSADSELVWQARLSTQAPDIDGVCYISDPGEAPLRAGEFRRMRITKAHDYDLTGELMADTESRQAVNSGLVLISARIMRCPICRKVVPSDSEFIPFCSDRCRIIDLGNWASEKYTISTPVDPQTLEEIPDQEDDSE